MNVNMIKSAISLLKGQDFETFREKMQHIQEQTILQIGMFERLNQDFEHNQLQSSRNINLVMPKNSALS